MCVETCISGCPRQALIISEGYVLIGPRILVSLGQAIIYHVHVMLSFTNADQVIIWLDISVKKASRVDILNPLDKLVG